MGWLSDPQVWLALATLTALEIVLGIDNIIFIAILAAKLPPHQQARARRVGLGLAMVSRIGLLFSLTWIMRLAEPLFTILTMEISGRDIVLIAGGLFLLAKSTLEIHDKLEGEEAPPARPIRTSFISVIVQIAVLDIVFSLDSVITAIGLANQLFIMVAAIVTAMIFMMIFVGRLNEFVERHPTIRMLALSFLLLVGLTLIGEGLDLHIPKGYVYFAMAFSVFVEMLNLRVRARPSAPVQLRKRFAGEVKERAI